MILTCDVTSAGREATSHGTAQTQSMVTRGHLPGKCYSVPSYSYLSLGLSVAYSVSVSFISVIVKFT
jgi:hypothetical protein